LVFKSSRYNRRCQIIAHGLLYYCTLLYIFLAYLKGVVPFGARVKGRSRDTWLLIGSVIAAVSLLIVLAALFTLGLSKKRAHRRARGNITGQRPHDGENGTKNLAFVEDLLVRLLNKFNLHNHVFGLRCCGYLADFNFFL